MVFDKPFEQSKVWSSGEVVPDTDELKEEHVGAALRFNTQKGEQVHARVASSFISFDQAERNLKELGNQDL